jgi:hypothetical protein
MTTYADAMTRTRHPRASGERRVTRLVAMVMLLLTLAAGLLVPAGSAHHHPAAPRAAVVYDQSGVAPISETDHRHGNEWTPTLHRQLRPTGDLAILAVLPARPGPADPAASTTTPSTPGGSEQDILLLLSVLRL